MAQHGPTVWKPTSHNAHSISLLLACSRADAVPAFIFWRPWQNFNKWAPHGELEQYHNLPVFSEGWGMRSSIFIPATVAMQMFPASSISWYQVLGTHGPSLTVSKVSIPPDIEELLHKRVITISYEDGLLYFKISTEWKLEIRRMNSSKDLIRASSNLAIMAIKSLPDPYSEPLWELLSSHCAEIFQITVLPFLLSIEDFEKPFVDFRAITLHDLEKLVLHLSFWSNSNFTRLFQVLGGLVDIPPQVENLIVSHQAVFEYIVNDEENGWLTFTKLIKGCLEDSYLACLFGVSLSLISRRVNAPELRHKMLRIIDLQMRGWDSGSTMMRVAYYATSGRCNGDLTLIEARLLASVGIGFATSGFLHDAIQALQFVLRIDGDKTKCFHDVELAYLSAELVKCLTSIGKEIEAESLGSQTILLLSPAPEEQYHRADLCCLLLNTADALIGQTKYQEAESMLRLVTARFRMTPYMTTITALRLNKISRRMGLLDSNTFLSGNELSVAVASLRQRLPTAAKIEVISELLATIAHLRLIDQLGAAVEMALANLTALTLDVARADDTVSNDWRVQRLHDFMDEDLGQNALRESQDNLSQDFQTWIESVSVPGLCLADIQKPCSLVPLEDVEHCRPDPTALPQLEIPQPSTVATNQRQNEAEICQSEMQGWWDQAIRKILGLPEGYQKVSVLLIKWDDEIDQLKVKQKVNDIGKLFKDIFNYQTDLVELKAVKPQLQLESKITHFSYENDAKHNLLILYYAGHGIYHNQEKDLYLAASNVDDESRNELPRVSWNNAIRTLVKNAEGDIFALMDCCFASNPYARSISDCSKTFEILAASGFNQITSSPKEDSFTTALIQSLKELTAEFKNGSFSTRDLLDKILAKRPHSPPALWCGLPYNNRHIRLSPIKDRQEPQEAGLIKKTSGGLLSLQFMLEIDRLSHSQVEKLTRNLPKVFRSAQAPVQDVVWLDFKNVRPPKTILKTAATMIASLHRWKNLPGDSKSSTHTKRKADLVTLDNSDDVTPKKKVVMSSPESSLDY